VRLGAPTGGPATGRRYGYQLALGDFTCDTHADLIVRNSVSTTAIDFDFFSAAMDASNKWMLKSTPDFSFHSTTGKLVSAVSIPDVDGDKCPELALAEPTAASNAGKIYVFFSRTDWSPLISNGVVDVSKADVTISGGDAAGQLGNGGAFAGVPDPTGTRGALIVSASWAYHAFLFPGQTLLNARAGAKTLSTSDAIGPFLRNVGAGLYTDAAAVADANGDGLADVIIGDGTNNALFVYLQGPAGSFTIDPQVSPFATGVGNFGYRLLAGNLNTHSPVDLVVGGSTTAPGSVTFLWSKATPPTNPLITPAGTVLSGGNTYGNSLSLIDINGDGLLDVAAASPGGGTDGHGKVTFRY
jgi:hypothetical protein